VGCNRLFSRLYPYYMCPHLPTSPAPRFSVLHAFFILQKFPDRKPSFPLFASNRLAGHWFACPVGRPFHILPPQSPPIHRLSFPGDLRFCRVGEPLFDPFPFAGRGTSRVRSVPGFPVCLTWIPPVPLTVLPKPPLAWHPWTSRLLVSPD